MNRKQWTILLALSLLWGGSFFFFKVLVAVWPPFTIVLGRVALAALALWLFLAARGERMPRDPALWRDFAVMGLLNNIVPFSLIAFGEARIASGMAAILNATTPIFAVLAAHALTDEKLTGGKATGVAFGFAGVAVLVGPAALHNLGGANLVGEAACLAAALSYAFAGIYGRRFREVAPIKVATGQVTASAIVLVPLALLVDRPWALPLPRAGAWAALAGIAILSTALAYILYFRLLAAVGATNLMLVTFLLPVSALALGAAFLGEAVTWQAVGGMMLIGLGFAAIDGRPWRAITGRGRTPPVA